MLMSIFLGNARHRERLPAQRRISSRALDRTGPTEEHVFFFWGGVACNSREINIIERSVKNKHWQS